MTAKIDLEMYISHSQFSVFDKNLEFPFNHWASEHVNQGFAWRQGSVSFATVEEAGNHLIEVIIGFVNRVYYENNAPTIIIDVSFVVSACDEIIVGSISDEKSIKIDCGLYQLRYEYFGKRHGVLPSIRMVFEKNANPVFRVVSLDREFDRDSNLVLTASPA